MPYPDQSILKLSDAFKNAASLKNTVSVVPELELFVKVYNINKGHNSGMVHKSKALEGYSYFIDKIREYRKGMQQTEAMEAAIKYCIEHDVLRQFLETNSSEVYNMLITEWNTEDAKEVWFEEGFEEGIEKGIEKGIEQMVITAGRKNISIEQIEAFSGLSREKILEIIKSGNA
jgi:heme-degrading monooxygenase HmoA